MGHFAMEVNIRLLICDAITQVVDELGSCLLRNLQGDLDISFRTDRGFSACLLRRSIT